MVDFYRMPHGECSPALTWRPCGRLGLIWANRRNRLATKGEEVLRRKQTQAGRGLSIAEADEPRYDILPVVVGTDTVLSENSKAAGGGLLQEPVTRGNRQPPSSK